MASGSPKMGTNSTMNNPHASQRPSLEDRSTAASGARKEIAVEREQPHRQHDVDHRRAAAGGVVELLDRLAVDHHRQRDHALSADEQHDAEFVEREQQAQATAGE